MPDVGKLLSEDDYGDDDFEEEPPPKAKPGQGLLATAARTVAREESLATKALLNEAAKEVRRSTEKHEDDDNDPLAAAAREVFREEHEDDDEEDEDDDDARQHVDENVNILLHSACFRGDMKDVRDVIEKSRANIKWRDRHGWSALHFAASSNSSDILRYLLKEASAVMTKKALKHYVNAQAKDTGWCPIHCAVVKGALDSLEVLIDHPCISINKKNLLGETAADCVPSDKSSSSNKMRRLLGVTSSSVEMTAQSVRDDSNLREERDKEREDSYREDSYIQDEGPSTRK